MGHEQELVLRVNPRGAPTCRVPSITSHIASGEDAPMKFPQYGFAGAFLHDGRQGEALHQIREETHADTFGHALVVVDLDALHALERLVALEDEPARSSSPAPRPPAAQASILSCVRAGLVNDEPRPVGDLRRTKRVAGMPKPHSTTGRRERTRRNFRGCGREPVQGVSAVPSDVYPQHQVLISEADLFHGAILAHPQSHVNQNEGRPAFLRPGGPACLPARKHAKRKT